MTFNEKIKDKAREAYLGYRDNLAYKLNELRDKGDKEIAQNLLDDIKNDEKSFKKYLKESNRRGIDILNNDLTHKYTDTHISTYILENLDKFSGCTHTDIINKMFEIDPEWRSDAILPYLDNFKGIDYNNILDKEVKYLAHQNFEDYYYSKRGKFKGVDLIIESKNKFKGISDEEFVKKLVDCGYADDVARHIKSFKGLNEDSLKSIILGCKDIKKCPSSDVEGWNQILAEILIERGEYDDLFDRLFYGRLKGLRPEMANDLIKSGKGDLLVQGLGFQCFEGLDYQVTVEKLIEYGDPKGEKNNYMGDLVDLLTINNKLDGYAKGRQVFGHFEPARYMNDKKLATKKTLHDYSEFKGLDYDRVINTFVEYGHLSYIPRLMYKSKSLNHNELADKMIMKNEEEGCKVIAKNLKNFTGLSQNIADKLVENGYGVKVIENLNKFEGLDLNKLAKKMIEKDEKEGCRIIAANLRKFGKLDNYIAKTLAKNGYSKLVIENPKIFG